MSKVFRRILAAILVVSLLLTSNISALAAGAEEYICELRLIYAEDYEEAKDILASSEFKDYKLFKNNLNEGTGEIGVWLAYKSTTDIDDAITDIAIMQMNGGYQEGNYQAMLQQSYDEYVEMGGVYLEAIKYFSDAYDAGDFLAESAFRQLNFYNVETQKDIGLEIPTFEGERLGDIFVDGITKYELATMFMQGNSYALKNVRALLAMGVSYNEDGMTYLEKVGAAAEEMIANPSVFADKDYDDFASVIAVTVSVFKDMFKELEAHEDDLNYEDDDFTEDEIYYLEYKAFAEMMRDVKYLDGTTLYDFCLKFENDESNYSSLYPLVHALNDGQIAMTQVGHYYDVVRYCMAKTSEEALDEQISELEEQYAENSFNIYTGVDRSVYTGTFALTSEAYRADAYTDSTGLFDYLFGEGALMTGIGIGSGVLGGVLCLSAVLKVGFVDLAARAAAYSYTYKTLLAQKYLLLGTAKVNAGGGLGKFTVDQLVTQSIDKYSSVFPGDLNIANYTFMEKYELLQHLNAQNPEIIRGNLEATYLFSNQARCLPRQIASINDSMMASGGNMSEQQLAELANATTTTPGISVVSGVLYVAGGLMMLYSAYRLGKSVYNYYHPDYDDIPTAMVDLIETDDGDRYIKYDVVYNAETNKDGVYEAGDLNAFEAQRWNALYYTKSYEAGKPLLANSFTRSTTTNNPKTNYAPVHRFGEVVCYDLNKYNFDYDTNIYLSVKQSRNNKSAIADVPEIVGSIFTNGLWILFAGIGAFVGVGGTLGTQALLKKKRTKVAKES